MLNENKIDNIYAELLKMFPNAHCELNYHNDYELLISVMLSAQTTDKAVNLITPNLFAEYPTLQALANANVVDVEKYIHAIGLYHNKALNIINASKAIIDRYNGIIPNQLDDLKSLPGVGQKTANVVLTEWFKIPRIPVDTHVERVSKRLGLVEKEKNVLEVENKLMSLLPEEKYHMAHHLLLFFGRYHCFAKNPKCDSCPFKQICQK